MTCHVFFSLRDSRPLEVMGFLYGFRISHGGSPVVTIGQPPQLRPNTQRGSFPGERRRHNHARTGAVWMLGPKHHVQGVGETGADSAIYIYGTKYRHTQRYICIYIYIYTTIPCDIVCVFC